MKKVKRYDVYTSFADLAHLVERHLAKVEVAGSSPVIRSTFPSDFVCGDFLLSFFVKISIVLAEVYCKNESCEAKAEKRRQGKAV